MDTTRSEPYDLLNGDISKNMVVPGRWFNWVNCGLGMLSVVADLEADVEPYVETNKLTGQITIHLGSQEADFKAGWGCRINGNLVEINPRSIATVNQKLYYLNALPNIGIVGSLDFSAVEYLAVWLKCIVDPAGGDNHVLTVESGSAFPEYDSVTNPTWIIRPICEIDNSSGLKKYQHAFGLIVIDVP